VVLAVLEPILGTQEHANSVPKNPSRINDLGRHYRRFGRSAAYEIRDLESKKPRIRRESEANSRSRVSAEDFVGVQPSVGDSIDRYHGWADGNPDLFKADRSAPTDSGERPDIYMGLGGNPDLRF
jgi:hypothetical protein